MSAKKRKARLNRLGPIGPGFMSTSNRIKALSATWLRSTHQQWLSDPVVRLFSESSHMNAIRQQHDKLLLAYISALAGFVAVLCPLAVLWAAGIAWRFPLFLAAKQG